MPKKSKTKLGRLQTVLVPKDLVSTGIEAGEIASKYGPVRTIESMSNFYRCRIHDDSPKTYHTRRANRGIQLVYGGDEDDQED